MGNSYCDGTRRRRRRRQNSAAAAAGGKSGKSGGRRKNLAVVAAAAAEARWWPNLAAVAAAAPAALVTVAKSSSGSGDSGQIKQRWWWQQRQQWRRRQQQRPNADRPGRCGGAGRRQPFRCRCRWPVLGGKLPVAEKLRTPAASPAATDGPAASTESPFQSPLPSCGQPYTRNHTHGPSQTLEQRDTR